MMTTEERAEFEKQMKNDKELTAKIQKEYGGFLKKQGIDFSNHQGFYVKLPLKNTDHSFTHVCDVFEGDIFLADYCGNCCCDSETAEEIADTIQEKCPDVRIDVEKNGSYELSVYHEFKYSSIEELHKKVLRIAQVVDIGAGIGKEMLGDGFER